MEQDEELPLWEVFLQTGIAGEPHVHAGSIRASGSEMALQNARDVYCRRGDVQSIWVVPSHEIAASRPDENPELFEPAAGKIYRYPQYYSLPKGMKDS